MSRHWRELAGLGPAARPLSSGHYSLQATAIARLPVLPAGGRGAPRSKTARPEWEDGLVSPRTSSVTAALLLCVAVTLPSCSRGSDDGGPGPGPVPPSGPIVYTAIGASDAAGIGSSVPCIPFTSCPGGRGYVPTLVRSLESSGRAVRLLNLGIPGTVLGPSIQALGRQHGRDLPGNFLDQQLPFVPADSTLVTVFAGGNDANVIAVAIERGAAGSDVAGFVQRQARSFAADYATLVSGVRGRAPSARVIVINLPNLALLPYVSGRTSAERRILQDIAVALSREANGMASRGAVVVDLMCNARSYEPGNYSSDGFHPDDSGYQYLAGEVERAVDGDPGSPPSDCSWMREAS
jgi:lysophospholipase L1-like esterase